MKVQLIKDARLHHKAGEIVEVSPAEYKFLVSVNAAKPVVQVETPKKGRSKK